MSRGGWILCSTTNGWCLVFADERRKKILERLAHAQSVTVSVLAAEFGLSESTIRRDLQELDELGLLKRTHGGAVPIEVASFEPTLQEKHTQRAKEKSAIAKAAVEWIQPGDTILLDSGTTTLQLARLLPDMELTVVTNSLMIAEELASYERIHRLILGGELRTTTGAMVGPFTELVLSRLHVDKFFLGANGVHLTFGVTTPNAIEAATKRAMMRSAREVILVADHSKLQQRSLVKICDIDEIHTFITDAPLATDEVEVLNRNGVKVVVAEETQQKE